MTAKECIKGRRSIRKFKDQKVSGELPTVVIYLPREKFL